MSATRRGSDRLALDQYPTPRWVTQRFLEAYELPAGIWMEPCAGEGSIIRAVSEVRTDVAWNANELDEQYLPALRALSSVYVATGADARAIIVPKSVRVVLTNPPFIPSLEILEAMLRAPWALTVFLQRLNWAAGPRRDLFRSIEPSVYVLPDRPSFVDVYEPETPDELEPGTDSIEYAWFVFDGHGDFRVLGDTPMGVRRAEIEDGRANGSRPKKAKKSKLREKEAA